MEWFDAGDYEVARQVLQRGVAACYLIGFVSAINQFPVLLGDRGLLPVARFTRQVRFRQSPSLFHWRYSDRMLRVLAWSGAGLAAALVAGLPQLAPPWLPMACFLLLFAAYLSIVNVGQTFYSFGWESLLLEAGFVVAFLGSNDVAPPLVVILFCRWLLFRLEFGAGLIKIRGGQEWRDLTALYYHHETQPMPNPVSWFVHHLPKWFHRGEVLGNHFAQLVVPFFLFAPQPLASVAGLIVILTQGWLVLTGNFAWLNWITIVLAFSAIDDTSIRFVLGLAPPAPAGETPLWFVVVVLAATGFLLVLSWWPLRNLFARRQLMNASFNRYHLVNAYGAFGTVTKERFEVVVEGSDAADPGDESGWLAYEFRGKPGDPARMPRQFAPYHLRLDWLMWFLALGTRDTRWFEMLLARLLEGDRATLRMLRANPFPSGPPRYVRARVFLYRFSTPAERRATGDWWVRSEVGMLVPPVSLPGGTRA
ncbi:lipase maturation factor family protein [Cryobacterium sp. TMT2-10]|uniref:Lipase maturation factor family protein n=1 Tax=Cryobacterium shii TaxID=1259235 RepID=A0AAQ2C8F0_9MICO|nr:MULTISPECIES: lipase maturation factor family protein [Cryobacterium]TFC52083.1 lipase maturation factor family protein [Cryobacterium shii]TFC84636.1 lipase maturation factor family protein [Cryobacterium sp. TmT2-59]TFD19031.1 lipase maturation factor family protein [Cryobacterium sp. TMT4-10]TFD36997.1 lipase maturation factor family protein [Cryobacterium sp. TMT2-10]